jgi:sugar lactone lactonase YvrE
VGSATDIESVDDLPRIINVGPDDVVQHLAGLLSAECPFWDEASQSLWFVDMTKPALVRLFPANGPSSGKVQFWTMPETISSFALCDDDRRVIVALADGLFILDTDSGQLTLFVRPEPKGSSNRLNDGKASPEGRFWIGGMNQSSPRRPTASLFRIEPDGLCTQVLDGLITSNGLAWSADGRRMFHSDSRAEALYSFDYEPKTGEISNPMALARLTENEGRPDGGSVDAEGCYWSAGASAGCLNRFTPDGRLIERYMLPVAAPSMLCFGGPELSRIFVTCLLVPHGGFAEMGGVLSFQSPVPGLAGHKFRLASDPVTAAGGQQPLHRHTGVHSADSHI